MNNNPIPIDVWWLFLEISFFKTRAKIFLGSLTWKKSSVFYLFKSNTSWQRWTWIEWWWVESGLMPLGSWEISGLNILRHQFFKKFEFFSNLDVIRKSKRFWDQSSNDYGFPINIFLRYGHSKFQPRFSLETWLIVPGPISHIWYHSIELDMEGMMTICIWFDHVWFPRYLNKTKFSDSLLWPSYVGMYDLSLKKILPIFSKMFIFLNYVPSERRTSHSHVGPTYMASLCIFLKIWFFKVWTYIFLPQADSPTTSKKFWIFEIYIWCHSVDIATTRTVMSCKWWDHSWFSRIFLLQILSFPLPVSK